MPFLTPMGQRLALSAADYWETSPDFYMIAIVEDYMGTCIQLEDIYLDWVRQQSDQAFNLQFD